MVSLTHRSIAVVTGSRADFGLLQPVMHAITTHSSLSLQTIVAGAHLASGTWSDIESAGFSIEDRVPMQSQDLTGRAADVESLGTGIIGFGRLFEQLQPDVILVLGDRIEAFAAASAAAVGGRHLAHLHGGDRAEGVADESMRHAVSKLAHIHFPATIQSADRLITMGESRRRTFVVGSPAVDGLQGVHPSPHSRPIVCMQHPIGAADDQERRWMSQTLEATDGMDRLVMAPNSDPGSAGIGQAIEDHGVVPIQHVPRTEFLSLIAGAELLVGNSSAGLIEAAVLHTAAVNIGPRQRGRERPATVVDSEYGTAPVTQAMASARQLDPTTAAHPYGDGHTGQKVAEHLGALNLADVPIRKQNTY
jgi:UDP-hydrolysing UDP-N-acetyl-D-glucosamine 2-epimerase